MDWVAPPPWNTHVTNLMIALRFSISALLILFCSTVISPVSFDTLYSAFDVQNELMISTFQLLNVLLNATSSSMLLFLRCLMTFSMASGAALIVFET